MIPHVPRNMSNPDLNARWRETLRGVVAEAGYIAAYYLLAEIAEERLAKYNLADDRMVAETLSRVARTVETMFEKNAPRVPRRSRTPR